MKAIWTKTAFLAALLFSTHTVSAQLTVANTETLVNSNTASTQQGPAVAMDTSGRYVVVWESELEDGSGYGVYAKIYNKDHSVRVSDFLVNTSQTTNDQRHPDVAITPDGTIAIVWQSNHLDAQRWISYIKFYDIDGVVVGSRKTLDNSSLNHQFPVVAASDDQFAVAFMTNLAGDHIYGIQGKYYDNTGTALVSEFVVDSTAEHLSHPTVALDSNGNAIYAWQHHNVLGGDVTNIRAVNIDNTGSTTSSIYNITVGTSNNKIYPSLARASTGEFIVAYSKFNADGDHYGIYGSRFSNSGGLVGSEFRISNSSNGSQDHPQINCTRDGAYYAVTWTDESNDGDLQGVYARVFDYSLNYLNTEQLINTTTDDRQMLSDVALSSDTAEAVFVWQGGLRKASTTGLDTDEYGVYTAALEVADNEPPVAICQNITVYLDGTGNVSILPADVDGGSTDNIGITSMTLDDSSFTCTDVGSNIVTLTVYDDAGLSDNCAAVVTVVDSVTPTAVCQDLTVYLDGAGNATITAGDLDNGSTDNCGVSFFSASQSSFTCSDVGANTVTLSVTDVNGNVGSCSSTVTVVDSVSPVAVCQDITVYLDGTGSATITAADIDAGSVDNCGISSYSASQTSFTCADVGANAVTLTVTDPSGNSAACSATVTVIDSVTPTAVCQDITVYLDATGNATITSGDLDAGSTDNCSIASYLISQSSFSCANVGANTVTLTVTDDAGNSAACTSTVTIVDSISPVASCQNVTVFLDGAGNATITAGDIDNGSTDNCGIASTSLSQSSFTCADVGANTVTLTVTDINGNSDVCSATVTVQDTTAPTAVCQNLTVYLDGSGNATITSGDVDAGSSDNCSIAGLSVSPAVFTCADVGANSVTLTVTDANGNSDACTATVTVVDSVSPTAVCQDITVYLDGTGNATITSGDLDNGSTDNCGIASYLLSQSSFTCADIGANSVTLTVTDVNGNTDVCSSTVTVVDSISPVASCQDITVFLDGAGNATITAGDIDNGSTDNCGIASTSVSQSSFTCADAGANTVTLTVTDVNGNSASCSATVTVQDTTAPTAFCQNLTVYLDGSGNATITSGDVDAGSSDNCGIASLSVSTASFTCADVGANSVTLTVTDANGNSDACTATVTVVDSVSPTAVCQDITVYLDGTGNATITSGDLDNGSTDNCGIASYLLSQSSFTCADIGANSVTLTVTDANGNTDACSSTVTVVDSISPVASCQDITVFLDGAGNATITAGDIDNGSTDNCGIASTSVSQSSFTCADAGANTVTLTVTDVNGNSASCSATVTVQDTTAPTAVCQDITVYLDGSGNASITSADIDNGSTDNCGIASLSISTASFTCADIGANTVTLTVTDVNGNSETCSATVTVADTTSPVTPVLADLSDECSVTLTAPTTTDNCGGTITGTTADPLTYTGDGSYLVTWTFDDGNGNSTTATQNVLIDDITAPVTPTLADITEECSTTVTAPTTTDNCAGTVTGTTTDPLTYSSEGTYLITWTFDDGNGNSTTATQNVIIDDVTAPVVPTLSDVTAECTATVTAPTATDNCSGIITGTTTDPLTYSTEGTYVITWSFDDGNGNTSTTTQNVIIDDVTAPVAPTLADLTDECSATASAPTTTDNCAGTVTGTTTDPTTYSTEGSYVITWTFDDGNGNTSTATQNVIIDDVTPPTASNVDTAYAECIGDVAVDISLVNDAADNCGSPVVTYVGDVSSNGSCNDTIVRTYNVADGGGNSIDVTQIIIINDVTPPTASTPVTLNVVCLSDVPSTTGSESWVIDEADNCGTPTVTWISDVSTNGTGCNDTITRTFEVADDCGNAITLTQLIIVNDDIVPIADLATLEDEVGFCDVTPATPTATDNCSGSLNGVPDVSFPINTPGTTVVTWTFTDDCGNTITQTQNVIVEQIEIGTYFAPDGTTIVASNNDPGVTFQWIDCETNTILPGETGQNFAPTYSSDFAVIVTQDGCSDTSDCVTISGVGLNTISNEAIVLFPNPSTGQFTIQYDGSLKLIEMYDVLGRLVLTQSDVEDGFIDASILAPGKYMVRVKTETDQSMVQPIVIGQK